MFSHQSKTTTRQKLNLAVHSYDAFHTRSDKPGVKGIIGMHRFNFCLVVLLWCENTITLINCGEKQNLSNEVGYIKLQLFSVRSHTADCAHNSVIFRDYVSSQFQSQSQIYMYK